METRKKYKEEYKTLLAEGVAASKLITQIEKDKEKIDKIIESFKIHNPCNKRIIFTKRRINNEDIIIGKISPIQPTGNNNKVYKVGKDIIKREFGTKSDFKFKYRLFADWEYALEHDLKTPYP